MNPLKMSPCAGGVSAGQTLHDHFNQAAIWRKSWSAEQGMLPDKGRLANIGCTHDIHITPLALDSDCPHDLCNTLACGSVQHNHHVPAKASAFVPECAVWKATSWPHAHCALQSADLTTHMAFMADTDTRPLAPQCRGCCSALLIAVPVRLLTRNVAMGFSFLWKAVPWSQAATSA